MMRTRRWTRDGSFPAFQLAHYVDKIDRSKRAVEAGGGNVIRPAIHRPVIIGDEGSDSDFGTNQHCNAKPDGLWVGKIAEVDMELPQETIGLLIPIAPYSGSGFLVNNL